MTERNLILAIDDEPSNLRILELDLEDGDYDVLTAKDGVSGWEILQEHKKDIKVILLDRMMPEMDGMEFMKKLKKDESVASIPVIMQTAAAEKEQVREGIEAGVYYYLTKPYKRQVMLSIFTAAIDDYGQFNNMRAELEQHKNKLHLVKENHFEVRTIEDAKYLATFLANFYPSSEQVLFGISELLINAVEHGNLGISYAEKGQLNEEGRWKEEVDRRLALPEHQHKRVLVSFVMKENDIILTIKDEGDGFDWREYQEFTAERATDNHGRGIPMTKKISFDNMQYLGCGNEVVCTVRRKKSIALPAHG